MEKKMYSTASDLSHGTIYLVNKKEKKIKIKCRTCNSFFFYEAFSVEGAAETCGCQNISIKTIPVPESKYKFWVIVEYVSQEPLIYEKTY